MAIFGQLENQTPLKIWLNYVRSPPLRTWNRFPIGVHSPEAPNRHRPQVMASPEGVHGRNRFWGTELQAPRIHLGHHR